MPVDVFCNFIVFITFVAQSPTLYEAAATLQLSGDFIGRKSTIQSAWRIIDRSLRTGCTIIYAASYFEVFCLLSDCFIVKIGGKSGRILAKARPRGNQFCTTQRLVVLSGTRPLSHVRCSGNRLNHTSPATTAHPTTQLPLSRSIYACTYWVHLTLWTFLCSI